MQFLWTFKWDNPWINWFFVNYSRLHDVTQIMKRLYLSRLLSDFETDCCFGFSGSRHIKVKHFRKIRRKKNLKIFCKIKNVPFYKNQISTFLHWTPNCFSSTLLALQLGTSVKNFRFVGLEIRALEPTKLIH